MDGLAERITACDLLLVDGAMGTMLMERGLKPGECPEAIKFEVVQQIAEGYWEPNYPSHLVTTCHRLRKVPIGQLSVEDLRILLGQSIGVQYLVPLVLEIMVANPLAEGDLYPGDLLSSALRLNPTIWRQHPDWAGRLESIVKSITDIPWTIRNECENFLSRKV